MYVCILLKQTIILIFFVRLIHYIPLSFFTLKLPRSKESFEDFIIKLTLHKQKQILSFFGNTGFYCYGLILIRNYVVILSLEYRRSHK
jgi:uncharacterized membrane protein